MAVTRRYGARGVQKVQAYPEAASQTFKKGDFLILDSNGRVEIAASAGANVGATSGAITNRIVGRAMSDASGTTGRMVDVLEARPDTEFELAIYHATPASAVPNTNQIGKQYELRYDSASTGWAVALADTTNVKLKVSDMYIPDHDGWDPTVPGFPTAASTTQYGSVYVVFMSEHSIPGGGA